ncbi:MAG: hypothetical protein KIT00_07890 [Rhodospirillales bacterium]|nr:hypothetical protein [Rhodospirillales bacterium]
MTEKTPPPPSEPSRHDRRERVRAAINGFPIHPETLLATDYLNHFNELVMLLEMLPTMPELASDLQAWWPMSYPEHFENSGLSYGELANEAYRCAPLRYRCAFDSTVTQTNRVALKSVKHACALARADIPEQAEGNAADASQVLRDLITQLGSIINGGASIVDQRSIDDLLNGG